MRQASQGSPIFPCATLLDRTQRFPIAPAIGEGSSEREGAIGRELSVASLQVAALESEARIAAVIFASAPRPVFLAHHLDGLDGWFDLSMG